MNLFEIKPSGQIVIRTDSGTVIREVGNGQKAEFADFLPGERRFVITYESGACELRDVNNRLLKTIAAEGISRAFVQHDGILLVHKDGRRELVHY